MKSRLEDITKELRSTQYRLTPQRAAVLRILAEHSDQHLSAEEVYELVRKKGAGIGLATVYRTLELLVETKIVHRVDFGDGRSRYEFASQERSGHYHLICLRCGEVTETKRDLLNQLQDMIKRQYGFQVMDHTAKFFGYCPHCQEIMDTEELP
ncbi:MAG: transcriptional repressor [Firmicutes bacterium]|nr:transcriptional repressor [Bacillota bacterium]